MLALLCVKFVGVAWLHPENLFPLNHRCVVTRETPFERVLGSSTVRFEWRSIDFTRGCIASTVPVHYNDKRFGSRD